MAKSTQPAKSETAKSAAGTKSARSKASIVSEQSAQLSEKIKESARQIWLAGLGAYTKAEEDTGKIFEKLVKEGEEIENLTRGVVEKQFKAVEDKVEGVREKASGTLNKLESVFDQRVSSALERLGIPSSSHVAELEKRIAALEAKLDGKK
jgi:poly(hydroxyalkanoate) granule-associated protein